MRTFLPLTAVLVAFAGSPAGGKAPVPKAPTPPSIDGKYTLLTTSSGGVTAKKGFAAAAADPADPWGGPRAARSDATITKNEITLEPRSALTGATLTMEYTLDPTKSPMTIDIETISVKGKRTKHLGVVEVSGNRLTLAFAREGADRPKNTEEGEGITVYYFQKLPPQPKPEFRIVAMTIGKEAEAEKELNKLSEAGFELVTTTQPTAPDAKSSPTTIHFVLKRTVRQP
jgi:uncharacterized protein (TIGR03067 family)